MVAILTLAIGLGAAVLAVDSRDEPVLTSATWTGWFSDKGCAAPRIEKGIVGPNNPGCVKRCLDEGATPVFVSEQAKALFEVMDYAPVRADLFYHLEVTGMVDAKAKTIAVKSVRRLEYVGPMCARPTKKRTG
jgi:hypothetical protein